jgi:hypothetical protein
MSFLQKIIGYASGRGAEVNTTNELLAVTSQLRSGVRMFSENDDGSETGTPYLKSPETSSDYRLRVGIDTMLFKGSFAATTQNSGQWKHEFGTMTMTQSAGFLNINAAGTSVASGHFAYLRTWRTFPMCGTAPLAVEFTMQLSSTALQANEVYQFGLGLPTGAAECVDGTWIEITNAGTHGCIRYNSGTTTKTELTTTALELNVNHRFVIIVGEREVEYWIDDVLYGEQEIPDGQAQPFVGTSLPMFIQKYNSGVVGSSPSSIMKLGNVTVTLQDVNTNKLWSHQMSGMGYSGQGLDGGTMAGLATWANSANPTTAAPGNGSLTANLPAGLGGQGLATVWNLAATDMVMLAWQNPTGGVAQPARVCYITGVKISAASFTAAWTAPAAGQHLFQWGLGYGAVAANMNASETASFATNTTKAARRRVLGLMGWATGATPIGTPADRDIIVKFDSPIVINPTEFLMVACKMLNGAATATGGMYFTVDFDHYFE